MKKLTVPNNTGSTGVIIVVAIVGVLVLALAGYLLYINKSTKLNPIAQLSNKCAASEKDCEIFDSINSYRETKKLSPFKYDKNVCTKIQEFTNDFKEMHSDGKKINNSILSSNLRKLGNDSKYEELLGDPNTYTEEQKNKEKRLKYSIRVFETKNATTDIEKYNSDYIEDFEGDYTFACVTSSSADVKGDYDFTSIYLVEFKK